MSYTGVRKCSIIKNHNNDYVLKCDCYDSSMTDYNNKRIWHNDVQLYQNCSFKSRAELEKQLFKDFLDGNLHGSYGKFSPLNWNSCKIVLPKEIDIKMQELGMARHGIEDSEKRAKAYDEYNNFRYSEYEKAWKQYLINNK